MKYDFTTLPKRFYSQAEKFVHMRENMSPTDEEIVPFSVADMDFFMPPELTIELKNYIEHQILGYMLPSDSYYEEVLAWMAKHHSLAIKREWLVDADNVIDALKQMIRCYSKKGDGVIVMTPAYPPFFSALLQAERNVLECPLKIEASSYYGIDYDLLEELCKHETTTLLLLCNPHNPVGRCWKREELERISNICLEHHVFILSDEIHWDLIMPGNVFTSVAALEEKYAQNCVVSTAASKTFNIAALKGAILIVRDEKKRQLLRNYMEQRKVPGRDILSYVAFEVGYKACEDWLKELLQVLDKNRRILKDFFENEIPSATVFPLEATYLQWIDFRFLEMSPKMQERFMQEKAKCYFTEGYKFGKAGEGFERWNIACPEDVLLSGLERMKRAIDNRSR